ncbi:MAG: M23 family metallopeptidase [Candidatus Rifleibacteriota bacterium]
MKKLAGLLTFLVFFSFSEGNLTAQTAGVEQALLKYRLSDLNSAAGGESVDQTAPATVASESRQTSSSAEILEKLLARAGKKEQKIIKQILEVGTRQKIINLQKLDEKLNKINVGGLVNLYQNLKALKIKKFDINRIDEIKQALGQIDQTLQQYRNSPKEYGDLSFFAGLTRDQLANVATSEAEKKQLRFSALANYNDTIQNLATEKDLASKEKVEDAKERVVTIETPFGNVVPIAPKKGEGKVYITSDYGMRTHPVKKTKRFHSGVDLAGWKCKGWKVFSIGPGRVIKSGWETGYGYAVIVSHEVGNRQFYSRYAHLLKNNRLKNGAIVKQGEMVGYCNNSGISTGSHLHFEVRDGSYSGQTLDPKEYLPQISVLK